MKKITTILLICFSLSTTAQKKITISFDQDLQPGQTTPANANYKDYLIQNLITYKIDTLKAVNGKISIPNNTTDITPYAVARMQPRQALIFYTEPNKDFSLTLSEPNFVIKSSKGSISQEEYTRFLKEQEVIQTESQVIQGNMSKAENQDSLRNRLTYLQMQANAKFVEFINYQKDNNLGAYMVYDVANKNQKMASKDLQALYDKLNESGKNTHFGKLVAQRVNRLTAMDLGKMAPDFTLLDKNGKEHSLSSLKGKYVLVDFWASWCGPCVREIPNLKTAYKKYQSKGFEIMSVSIDRKKGQWLKALEKHNMPWTNVIDHEENAKKITQTLYYVPTIPRTILLDKTGKVIGKDFRGNALELKLEEIFK